MILLVGSGFLAFLAFAFPAAFKYINKSGEPVLEGTALLFFLAILACFIVGVYNQSIEFIFASTTGLFLMSLLIALSGRVYPNYRKGDLFLIEFIDEKATKRFINSFGRAASFIAIASFILLLNLLQDMLALVNTPTDNSVGWLMPFIPFGMTILVVLAFVNDFLAANIRRENNADWTARSFIFPQSFALIAVIALAVYWLNRYGEIGFDFPWYLVGIHSVLVAVFSIASVATAKSDKHWFAFFSSMIVQHKLLLLICLIWAGLLLLLPILIARAIEYVL